VAASVPFVVAATGVVATANCAIFAPAGTTTDVGTLAFGWLSLSVTVAPPTGAGPVNVTVPTPVLQPQIGPGATVTENSAAGVTVRGVALITPPWAAEICTTVLADTNRVAI
jgi:hypothetical protein